MSSHPGSHDIDNRLVDPENTINTDIELVDTNKHSNTTSSSSANSECDSCAEGSTAYSGASYSEYTNPKPEFNLSPRSLLSLAHRIVAFLALHIFIKPLKFLLHMIKFFLNKKTVIFLIVAPSLLVTLYQIYEVDDSITIEEILGYTYYSPKTHLSYFEPNSLDFTTDSDVVDMIDLVPYFNSSPGYVQRDWRITPSLYLKELNNILLKNNGVLPESVTFKFSWADWINFDERLLPSSDFMLKNENSPIESCDKFAELIGYSDLNLKFKEEFLRTCKDLKKSEIFRLRNTNYPHFKFLAPIDGLDLSIETRIIHGSTYTYHQLNSPERLVFVDKFSKTDIIVPISNEKSLRPSAFSSSINKNIKSIDYLNNLVSIPDLMDEINSNINSTNLLNFNKEPVYDISRITRKFESDNDESNKVIRLSRSDFNNYNNLHQIETFLVNRNEENSLDNRLYLNLKSEVDRFPTGHYNKYFHEPGLNDKGMSGGHYDWRFFNMRDDRNDYKKFSTLNRIVRAWLRFTSNENITTWLVHGTLLGYSFNNLMLPYDNDHDVQVSASSMWKLAKYFNQSLIIDSTIDDPFSSGNGQYFLDIAGSFFDRRNLAGSNAIDGRFIDIHTGMYIDITVVCDIEDKNSKLTSKYNEIKPNIRDEFERMLVQYNISKESLVEQDDLIGCKNDHFYKFEELSEFKRSLFEGEFAYVQSKYETILDREFPKRHDHMNIADYTWRRNIKLWVKDDKCDHDDREGDKCLDNKYVRKIFDVVYPQGLPQSDDDKRKFDNERRPIFPDWESIACIDKGIA